MKCIRECRYYFLSVIGIGELLSGFKGGNKEKKNLDILEDFLNKDHVESVEVSLKTASIFAKIKNFLKTSGKPIPINDVWIASHCFELDASLITYDTHFLNIPELKIWDEVT
ncbi:MAG: PIN domain-containing protein [Candidatus Kapaibacterium sp.]